jgi:hypothetical protein
LVGEERGVARGARGVSPIANFLALSAPELAGAGGLNAGEGEVFGIVQLVNDLLYAMQRAGLLES